MNRRRWLSLVLASSAASLVAPPLWATGRRSANGMGPGLFFDPARLDEIRDNYRNDPFFAELRAEHAAFDYAAEEQWLDTELRYNDQLFHVMRLGNTAETTAFIGLMTGDERAIALAQRCVRELMKFERWDFFLDGDQPIAVQRASQATVVLSFVTDVLREHIDPAERREWLSTMRERGCEPCFRSVEDIRHPRTVEGWRFDPDSTFFEHRPGNRTDMNRRPEITYNTNLRAVPAGALAIGAVACAEEFGSDADSHRWLEMAVWGMEDFRQFYKADGSYDEEVNYANYTALHLVQAIIALRRHGGADLSDLIDWDGFADFLLNMSMAYDADPWGVVNWGDSGAAPNGKGHNKKRAAIPAWIARETGNPLAQGYSQNLAGKPDHWAALWYDAGVAAELPADEPHLWVSELDRVVARTGYGPEHLVVALRSGPPANHEHADRNTLLVKCYGQQLITDPLRPPYSYSDPAWNLRLTEGHSGILIDGRGHQHHNGVEGTNASNSWARIVRHHAAADHATWVSDGTQPYRLVDTDIKAVVRSVAVLYDQPAIVLVDRISKWTKPSTVAARYFGYNWDDALEQSTDGNKFLVKRPGAVLRGLVFSATPVAAHAGQLDIPADIAARHPFIDVTSAPTTDLTMVTVLGLAPTEDTLPAVSSHYTNNEFTITIGDHTVRYAEGELSVG